VRQNPARTVDPFVSQPFGNAHTFRKASIDDILRAGGVITNDVRKILDEKLGFRNTCAHPNDIVIPDSKVLSAIEDLVYNVVLKYPL